ncbi:MAG TPA: head maturation protease, ClpP-related [Pseudolabrys sp.]|nr:head maturation protease, ClpP-related [Pseudolabrys sp.]
MPLLKDSTLTLYGAVSAEALPDSASFSAKDVRDALDEHGAGDMTINLNSAGGAAMEGLAIFNTLKNHPGKITINVDACALSAASLIAMAGDDIVMRDGALIMVHDPRTITFGTSTDHRQTAARLDVISNQFREIYARRTGKSEKAIGDLMTAETWMDADQAIGDGFATRKSDGERARIYASFDYSQYRNTPAFLGHHKRGTITMSFTDTDTAHDKPWAGRFFKIAAPSDIALADLNEIVASAANYEAARDALVVKMAAVHNANKPSPTGARRSDGNTFGNVDFLATTISDVLYARMSGTDPDAKSPARDLMGCSILDLGAKLIEARGERVSWANRSGVVDKIMMAGGEHSTSDFPNLLLHSGNRILLDAYEIAETPLKTLAKRRDAADFRPLTSIRLSEAPALLDKPEGGELKFGSRTESATSFSLKTSGRMFAITREALINDDLNAFGDSAKWWGRAAASYEADQLFALFSANGGHGVDLPDDTPLYDAGRGNLLTGGTSPLSITSLDLARKSLRGMKDIDGETRITVTPKHLVVGAAIEATALQCVAAITPNTADNVNPFSGQLAVHVEPRFTDNTWRLFADKNQFATIVIAYLNGHAGPQIKVREGWTTLGMEFRTILDFGCGIEDWRGTVMSAAA